MNMFRQRCTVCAIYFSIWGSVFRSGLCVLHRHWFTIVPNFMSIYMTFSPAPPCASVLFNPPANYYNLHFFFKEKFKQCNLSTETRKNHIQIVPPPILVNLASGYVDKYLLQMKTKEWSTTIQWFKFCARLFECTRINFWVITSLFNLWTPIWNILILCK